MKDDIDLVQSDDRACRMCNITKKIDEFPLNGDPRGGRRHQCKECMRKINRDWRKNKKIKKES